MKLALTMAAALAPLLSSVEHARADASYENVNDALLGNSHLLRDDDIILSIGSFVATNDNPGSEEVYLHTFSNDNGKGVESPLGNGYGAAQQPGRRLRRADARQQQPGAARFDRGAGAAIRNQQGHHQPGHGRRHQRRRLR